MKRFGLILVAALVCVASAHAQQASPPTPQPATPTAQPAAPAAQPATPATVQPASAAPAAAVPGPSANDLQQQAAKAKFDEITRYVLLGVLGLLAFFGGCLLWVFIRATHTGDRVAVLSHWGGFGNGLGGWRLSTSLAALIGAVMVLALAIILASVIIERDKPAPPPPDKGDKKSAVAPADPQKK
jgi:hypothetical protein